MTLIQYYDDTIANTLSGLECQQVLAPFAPRVIMDGELSTDQDSYHLTCGTQSSTPTPIRGRQQGVSPDKPTPLRQPQSTCQDTHFEMHWSTLIRPSSPEPRFSTSTPQTPSLQLTTPCLGVNTTTSLQLSLKARPLAWLTPFEQKPPHQARTTMYHIRRCIGILVSPCNKTLSTPFRETSNQTGTVQCFVIVDK